MPSLPRTFATLLASVLVLNQLLPASTTTADRAEPRPDPQAAVQAVFATHCVSCHGPAKQRGGLRLDRKADALAGGDSGKAIIPGKPAESTLLKRVTSKDEPERMPPSGARLSEAEVAVLRAWIADGAKWTEATTPHATDHWAFRPVVRPPVPRTDAGHNALDAFVSAQLSDNGLSLSPAADRRTLIRRLKFDLLGLPPTPEEVDAFVRDGAPDAFEQLVDRYLASPHHGERWARHWLDVVRFAESNGFEMNWERPTAWPYRDWVIRSLNDDKPYDRFVVEQLAGDATGANEAMGFLVGGPWDQVKSPDLALTAQQRADELHDMVSTTGSAFLGLTVGCARCHNHKFDPVPQVDYYHLKAEFAGVQHGERALAPADPKLNGQVLATLRAEAAKLDAQLVAMEPLADPLATTHRRVAVTPRLNTERFPPVRASAVRFVVSATNSAEPCLDELEVFTSGESPRNVAVATTGAKVRSCGNYAGAPSIHRLEFLNDGKYGNGRSWISDAPGRGWVEITFETAQTIDRVVWGRDREGKYADRLPTQYRVEVQLGSGLWAVVAGSADRAAFGTQPAPAGEGNDQRTRVARNLDGLRGLITSLERTPMVYAGRLNTPEPTFRLHRGDAMQQREPVMPGGFTSIGAKLDVAPTSTDRDRRLALARWIASPDNPLTARVIVNRLWQFHFGTGLVETPSDFGRNGGKPTHPALLDWLAAELVKPTVRIRGHERSAWSLKHVHRLIVTSAAYRQSSAARTTGLERDAQNRLLWRFTPRRLEAEAIRDSILAVSGKLDLTMGGPGFSLFEPNANYVRVYTPKQKLGPPEFRRMIYLQKIRMQTDDTFGAFDCPDAGQIAPKRNASTTPLQSLNLLNSPFVLEQAGFFAARVEKEVGSDTKAQVRRAFRLAFQRDPSDRERVAGIELVRANGLPALCRALFNANEFLYVD